MDCEQALALLSAYLDGEVPAEERALLAAHLEHCPECRTAADVRRLEDADLRRAFAARRRAATAVAERAIAGLGLQSPPARRRGLWLPVLLSAAAGFLMAVLLFRPWEKPAVVPESPSAAAKPQKVPPPQDQEAIFLAVAQGPIEVFPPAGSAWLPLASGQPVALGARVRTGPQARCEFRLIDGSEIRLNSTTELLFQSNRQFQLAGGQILARVADAPAPFRVAIPSATITAIGTEFDILCRPVESIVTVLEGAAEVAGNAAKQFVLTGEAATIVGGRIARKEPVHNLVQATSWTHEILKLKAHNNKELEKRVADILAQIGQSKTEFLTEEMIRGLGDHCVLPLTRFIQSERSLANDRQRHQAARLLSELAQPWSVPDLIKLLADKDGLVRYYAASGLSRLTKETFGRQPEEWRRGPWDSLEGTYKKWKIWWQENKERYPPEP